MLQVRVDSKDYHKQANLESAVEIWHAKKLCDVWIWIDL